jgi:hypothetical protein
MSIKTLYQIHLRCGVLLEGSTCSHVTVFGMRRPSCLLIAVLLISANRIINLPSNRQLMMDIPNILCVTNSQHSLNVHRFHPPSSDQPALQLYIPSCVATPLHPFHLLPSEQPLRIHIKGPLLALQKLLPGVS